MHRRNNWWGRLPATARRRAATVAAVVAALVVAAASLAYAAGSGRIGAIACADGSDLLVHPGGTWNCATPAPSSSAPGPTPSPSAGAPSSSPASTSPSPGSSSTSPSSPTSTTTKPGTPVPAHGCLANPGSCGYPNAASAGAHGKLTVVNGQVNLGTAGQVYADKEVHGCIKVTAPGVTIRDVKVVSNCGYGIDYTGKPGQARLSIVDTTVVCTGNGGTAVGEQYVDLLRADLSGCENGLDINTEVTVTDSYIHDLYDGGGAHSDGAQVWPKAANVVFRHNTFMVNGDTTSAVINGGNATNLTITGNLISGAESNPGAVGGPAYQIYCPANSTGVVISDNRFGSLGTNHGSPWGHGEGCGSYTWSGNVADATGVALRP